MKSPQTLQHGWTIFVAEEQRANSLIVLLTLSELKIAPTHKTWLWCAVLVRVMTGIAQSIQWRRKKFTNGGGSSFLKLSSAA